MRATALAVWTWLGLATALSLPPQIRGKVTFHRSLFARDTDPPDFFPFPANQSSIVGASTEPTGPPPPQDLTVDLSPMADGHKIPHHFIETKCDYGKKFKITQAWGEATQLAKAQTSFQIGYNYNIPHSQWLGPYWNDESSWFPWKWNYRRIIGENFRRLRQVFSDNAQYDEYIYWYCYDYSYMCHDGIVAYSWDRTGYLWSSHYTVFCDPFYKAMTMADQLAKYANDKYEQKIMENFQTSRGQVMLHEIWHYKNFVSSPRTDDYAYRAQRTWELARDSGTYYAYVNADSYALDAVAIFVQHYYKSSMSPVPWKELKNFDAAAAAAIPEPPADDLISKTFGPEGPPGWVAPVTDDPDLSIWTELQPSDLQAAPAPPTSTNACHGVGGDYWVMSRDVAVDNAKDFCGQTDQTKNYNSGSVNELELSAKNLDDDKLGPKDAPDCVARFQNAVIDGCDGNDPLNNPHNYKFGATLTTDDGWEYKMTPLSKQVNEVNCDVSYKWLFDGFEIRGKNLPDAKLGANGEGLHDQVSGCGILSSWNFERTPDDCCFQWYAAGSLPIGTRGCVGRALVSAGGSGTGNCHGTGKRNSISSDSIDNWPGYGDEGKHVFRHNTTVKRDSITAWPGYGDEGKHVFKNDTKGASGPPRASQ